MLGHIQLIDTLTFAQCPQRGASPTNCMISVQQQEQNNLILDTRSQNWLVFETDYSNYIPGLMVVDVRLRTPVA